MKPPMIDANGKRFKVGYLVHTDWTLRCKHKPYTVVRQTKKGNILVREGDLEVVFPPSCLHKLSLEDII